MQGEQELRITAVGWLAFADEGEDDETGEISQFARLVLFDRDGKFFRTTSKHALRRMASAMQLYPPSAWELGITFAIRQRTSKRGRPYHDIRIVPS